MPGMKWRRSEEQIQAIVSEYKDGAIIRELARKHKIGRDTVSKILKENGVKLRRSGLAPEQIDEAVQLYGKGWSVANIGNHFNVDPKTVWIRLVERDMRMRDTHGRSL